MNPNKTKPKYKKYKTKVFGKNTILFNYRQCTEGYTCSFNYLTKITKLPITIWSYLVRCTQQINTKTHNSGQFL